MVSIRIVEQPSKYHRFRYETEISGGKLGGLLYGRSGSKSCVRLALKGLNPAVQKSVSIVGATVNPEGYPHPFYMHGEGCENGLFQWRKEITVPDSIKHEVEICLEKVSLVCVPHGGDRLQQAIKKRESLGINPFNKNISDAKYNSKNVREVRLAFQVFSVDKATGAKSKGPIVQSDIIYDIKFQAKLEIEDIHPDNGFLFAKDQTVWVYFKDQLPHTDASQYSSYLDLDGVPLVQCDVQSLKKQLMVVRIPELHDLSGPRSERVRCSLRVTDLKSDVTAEIDFILCNSCSHCGFQLELGDSVSEPVPKRQRVSNGNEVAGATLLDKPTAGEPSTPDSHHAEPEPDLLVSVVSGDSNAAPASLITTFIVKSEVNS